MQIIKSHKIDISNMNWIIFSPTISVNNTTTELKKNLYIKTHFDQEKILNYFKNLSSLNIFQLIKLERDYRALGYSTNEIKSQLQKLISFPVYLTIMTLLASIMMFNVKRNKPIIFHIISGILLSTLIYYFYYLFNLMGETGKIPVLISAWLPFLLLTIFISIGLVRINEK